MCFEPCRFRYGSGSIRIRNTTFIEEMVSVIASRVTAPGGDILDTHHIDEDVAFREHINYVLPGLWIRIRGVWSDQQCFI